MKKIKSNSKLFEYLLKHQIDFSDKEAIALLKKEFYKEYNRTLKKEKRLEKRVFTITISKQLIHHLRRRCKEQGSDIPSYIKLLIKADINNTSVAQQTMIFRAIKQLLNICDDKLTLLVEKDSNKWFGNHHYDELQKILQEISLLLNKEI